ncbi:MAG: ATP-binding protein [Oligoflexia bacterium]|nr:ATP-binding protein [Oligoflexia bacterium]
MNTKTKEMLINLKLGYLLEYWDDVITEAEKNNLSYDKFLFDIIKKEYEHKVEVTTTNRIKRAKIPNEFTIDTYPFNEQPHLNKKRLLQRYDSLDYLEKNRNIIFVGPAGTGKTGLSSSILRHSLNQGYSGHFVEFNSLMEELLSSIADRSTKKVIKKYTSTLPSKSFHLI